MPRQPYSVAVLSTGGRLHPLPFWKGRGLGSGLRTLPLGRDRWGRYSTKGGYIPNPYGRDLGLGYRVRTPSSQEGDRGVEKSTGRYCNEEQKYNFFPKIERCNY